ncbi:Uncharacterized protein PECH_000185 [Penicillium ucsense]|uniref:Uncharacterized protein n=1 Tax=Penicillium ucsense TaxID=2839758 RepID=A0A8J8W923_9EURO|nr:Uncharacterized protein PECM_008512 [Penicillium ucsense]KAF7738468.1 Uncharacterized protein PECH_000185 [Penicillium ucsense]
MVIVWSAEWDTKLLVAIWETCGSKFDWESAAEILGNACTPEAIMQHLRNLTKKASEQRREQREVLLKSHAARDASVAKGKARRRWGYSRINYARRRPSRKVTTQDQSPADEQPSEAAPIQRKRRFQDDLPLFKPIEEEMETLPTQTNRTRKRHSREAPESPDEDHNSSQRTSFS